MQIGSFKIDMSSPCFIVAELSANHDQHIEIAKETIRLAKECGANAIKLQTYTPDTITLNCDNEYFKINQGTIWDNTSLYRLYEKSYTPWEWHKELKEYAESLGLIFFSTPFDRSAVDFLEKLEVPAYKVSSFEINDIPLIEYIASKQKPILMSTGIATMEDIEEAIKACRRMNNNDIILLKCTSAYPTSIEECNLLTMKDMKDRFNVEVGLSDHSIDSEVPISAVCLGAKVVEKHFIIDKIIGGPDASFSLEPYQFESMVESIRKVEKAMGKVNYELSDKQQKVKELSRSLFVVEDVKEGEIFTEENVKSIRPAFGLHPKYYYDILGKKANQDIKKGTPLDFIMIE